MHGADCAFVFVACAFLPFPFFLLSLLSPFLSAPPPFFFSLSSSFAGSCIFSFFKVVEEEKNALEAGKKEAEAYLREENELTILKSKLFQCYMHQATSNLEELESVAAERREKVKAAKDEMSSVLVESKGVQKQYDRERREHDRLSAAAEKAKADFIAYERKDIKHKEVRCCCV